MELSLVTKSLVTQSGVAVEKLNHQKMPKKTLH
jgi:hypothetical protein